MSILVVGSHRKLEFSSYLSLRFKIKYRRIEVELEHISSNKGQIETTVNSTEFNNVRFQV